MFSAGWLANIACMNAYTLSGSATATEYMAAAARLENSVPWESRSRMATGVTRSVMSFEATRLWIVSPSACSN